MRPKTTQCVLKLIGLLGITGGLSRCGGVPSTTSELDHVGGEKVDYSEVVAIGPSYSEHRQCTATRISSQHILTAAHCVVGLQSFSDATGAVLEGAPSPSYWSGQKLNVWRGSDVETARRTSETIDRASSYQNFVVPAAVMGSRKVSYKDVAIVKLSDVHQTDQAKLLPAGVNLEDFLARPENKGRYRILTGGTGIPFLPWSTDDVKSKYDPTRWDMKYAPSEISEYYADGIQIKTALRADSEFVKQLNEKFATFIAEKGEFESEDKLMEAFRVSLNKHIETVPMTETDLDGHSITSGDSGAPVFLEDIATKERILIGVNSFIGPEYKYDEASKSILVSVAQVAMRVDGKVRDWVAKELESEKVAETYSKYTCSVTPSIKDDKSMVESIEFSIEVRDEESFLPPHMRVGFVGRLLLSVFGVKDQDGRTIPEQELRQYPRLFETKPESTIKIGLKSGKDKASQSMELVADAQSQAEFLVYAGISESGDTRVSIIPNLAGIDVLVQRKPSATELGPDAEVIARMFGYSAIAKSERVLVPYSSCEL